MRATGAVAGGRSLPSQMAPLVDGSITARPFPQHVGEWSHFRSKTLYLVVTDR